MKIKITIIRHAPTEYNLKGIFMGSKDVLPAEGNIEDINKLIQIIKNYDYSKIYTSPLKRAYLTAHAINFTQVEVCVDYRLKERSFGEWEGCVKKDIQQLHPKAFVNGIMDFYYTPPKGEEFQKVIERVSDFLKEVYKRGENVVIVTHNGVFRVMKSLITGVPLSEAFLKSEPHLTPETFEVTENIIEKVIYNPFYTVD